jgi:hypothetical protein
MSYGPYGYSNYFCDKDQKKTADFLKKGAFAGNIRIIKGIFPKSGYGTPNPQDTRQISCKHLACWFAATFFKLKANLMSFFFCYIESRDNKNCQRRCCHCSADIKYSQEKQCLCRLSAA